MGELIGYARCSTVLQDLTAQRQALIALGVPDDRIYLDKGLTGTSRARPGLDQALAAVRSGDTLVVPKLDQLNIAPSGICTDEEFLRRVSLDVIGTLPTPDEVAEKILALCLPSCAETGKLYDYPAGKFLSFVDPA